MLHILSSLVLALIVAGVSCRRRHPALHVRMMTVAFVCDLLLVLYIEATRQAVQTVARAGPSVVWFHAGVSTLVLVAYMAQLTVGRRVLAGAGASRRLHRIVGIAFLSLRSLNYVTSFLI